MLYLAFFEHLRTEVFIVTECEDGEKTKYP